ARRRAGPAAATGGAGAGVVDPAGTPGRGRPGTRDAVAVLARRRAHRHPVPAARPAPAGGRRLTHPSAQWSGAAGHRTAVSAPGRTAVSAPGRRTVSAPGRGPSTTTRPPAPGTDHPVVGPDRARHRCEPV